jgi:hypothetical protein
VTIKIPVLVNDENYPSSPKRKDAWMVIDKQVRKLMKLVKKEKSIRNRKSLSQKALKG